MNTFTNLKYIVNEHFNRNKKQLIILVVCLVVGIVFGVVFSFGDLPVIGLLKLSNQNIVSYINGTAKCFTIFIENLLNVLIGLIIIFIFCLNYFTSFLSYLYIIYQSCVLVLTISAIGVNYTFLGITSIVLFIVPANILLFALIIFYISVCRERAIKEHQFGQKFSASFDSDFWILILIIIILLIIFMVLIYLILPLILKGIYIINY